MRYQYLIDLSTAISMLVVTVMFLILFESRLSRRAYLFTLIPFLILFFGVNLYILIVFGLDVQARYTLLTTSLPSLVYFWLVAKHRGGRFFFAFCLVDTVMIWVMMVSGLIDYAVGSQGLVNFVLRMAAFPAMLLFTWRLGRRPYLSLLRTVSRGWWLFTGMTGLFYLTLTVMGSFPTNLRQRPEAMPGVVMVLILLPLIYVTIFAVLYQQDELFRVRERQNTFEAQSSMIEQRANEIRAVENRVRIERHDLRHRLQAISAMVQQGENQAVLDYIGASQAALEEMNWEHYCGNPTLDAILGSYFRRAEQLGIQVEAQIALPEELPVPTAELSTVFANALENMIHAVQKLPPEDRRVICKCICSPRLMLEFSNPCDGSVRFGVDGLPVAGDEGHGIGTRSIMAFVEKYHAVCSFRVEDGWFKLQLAL